MDSLPGHATNVAPEVRATESARMAWRVAQDEYEAVREAIRRIEFNRVGAQAHFLRAMLPDAQRRMDEAKGRYERVAEEMDVIRREGLMMMARAFCPPPGDPLTAFYDLDLTKLPPLTPTPTPTPTPPQKKRGPGRPRKVTEGP